MPKLASLIVTLALFSSYAIRIFADAIIEARGTSIQEWKKSKKRALLKFAKNVVCWIIKTMKSRDATRRSNLPNQARQGEMDDFSLYSKASDAMQQGIYTYSIVLYPGYV